MKAVLESTGYGFVSWEDFRVMEVTRHDDLLRPDGVDATILVLGLEWLLLNPSLQEWLHEAMLLVDIIDEDYVFTLISIPVLRDLLLISTWVVL